MTDDFVNGTGIIPDGDPATGDEFDPNAVISDDFLDDEAGLDDEVALTNDKEEEDDSGFFGDEDE